MKDEMGLFREFLEVISETSDKTLNIFGGIMIVGVLGYIVKKLVEKVQDLMSERTQRLLKSIEKKNIEIDELKKEIKEIRESKCQKHT